MKKVLSFFLAVVMLCSAAPVEAYAATAPKATSITKLTTKNGAITVKWKKVKGVTGYQIQYSTDEKFKKNVKKVTVKKAKTVKKTIKKLKVKKTYYVRVRAYKLKKGKKKYSKWCKKKSIKVKKAAASSASGKVTVLIPNKLRINAKGDYEVFVPNNIKIIKEVDGLVYDKTQKSYVPKTETKTYPNGGWFGDLLCSGDEVYVDGTLAEWNNEAPIIGSREGDYFNLYCKSLYELYQKLNLNDNMNDIDKLTIIARWFEENYTYAYKSDGVTPDMNYSSGYKLIKYKKGVCSASAVLLRDLCYLIDVPSIELTGDIGNGESHAWNAVKLQGYWYQVDFTGGQTTWWGDQEPLFEYIKHCDEDCIEYEINKRFGLTKKFRKRKPDTEVLNKCVPQGTYDTAYAQLDKVIAADSLARNHQFK